MYSKVILITLFSVLLQLSVVPSQAQTIENNVKIDIIASVDKAVAGDTFDIAIIQNIDKGWHTYWKNPGDSGIPLSFTWTKPEGVEFGDYSWSVPDIIRYEGVVDYGYSNTAYITASVTLPDTLEGDDFILTADASWLVCKEICIPESQTAQIILPIGETSKTVNEDIFEDAYLKSPRAYDGNATYAEKDGKLYLKLDPAPTGFETTKTTNFFPEEWGIIRNGTVPTLSAIDSVGFVEMERDNRDLQEIADYRGLLKYEIAGTPVAYDITFTPDPKMAIITSEVSNDLSAKESPIATDIKADVMTGEGPDINFITALFYSLVGGLILNLMPCVFPILSMKALSFTKLSAKERKDAAKHGLFYTFGVVASMLVFGGLLVALKSLGSQIGWGFQMQNPLIVTALFCLFFLIGLNFLGLFDVKTSFGSFTNRFSSKHGYRNDFMTGVLVVLVATPCTAPFMAAALGYALVQPAIVTLCVFAALGFGLAFPFLLLALLPSLQKHMPKPGAWMVVFKQLLAFPMFIACVWLAWVLTQQTGANGIAAALMGSILIAFFIFVSQLRSGWILILTGVVCLYGFYKTIEIIHNADVAYQDDKPHDTDYALAFTPAVLEGALATDKTVFVNMTAAWCITCKVNERTTIKNARVMRAFEDMDVTYIMGDWTRFQEDITHYLESFGRSGVPIYVLYKKPNADGERDAPVLLPQILTPDIVLNALEKTQN